MAGSSSVSNLTVCPSEPVLNCVLISSEDRIIESCCRQWQKLPASGKRFSRTVNNSTNDLVNLSLLCRIGACESLAESWGERGLNGLEGAANWSRPPEGGGSERPGDAAVCARVSEL